jgi:abortive infection bacteriophage resistance protein
MSKVKSIDSLMKYLRDAHKIKISGGTHKRKLRNIGYYHGFKGYRFITMPNNRINYTDFNEVLAINKFDMDIKTLFYPQIMFIETALKNYVLEVVIKEGKTECFNTIYENILNGYKIYSVGSSKYNSALKKRLRLRNQFYSVLTRDYSNNKNVVQHFYHKDIAVPIWAIFEIISLGEFGNFVSCANTNVKQQIGKSLNLNESCNIDGKLTESIIYLIKDLRNSIAHNDVIFDTRFRGSEPNRSLVKSLQFDTNIININFKTIVDYLILIIYLLKNLETSKTELKKIVTRFESLINQFRREIQINVYNQIFYTDTRNKLNLLKTYVSS